MCDSYWGFNDFLQSPFCELPQPVPNYFDTPDLAPIEPDDIPPSDEPFQFEPVVYHSYRNPPPCLQTCSSSGIIPDTTGPLPHTYVERTHVYPPIIQSDITLRPLACIPTHDPQTRVFPCPYFGHDRRKFAACEKIKYKAVSHIRQHIRTAHLKSSVWCRQCGTGFGDNDRLLNRHDPRDCKRIAALRGGPDSPQVRAHISAEEESFFGKLSKEHLPTYPKDDKARYRRARRPLSALYPQLFSRCTESNHFCEPLPGRSSKPGRTKTFVRKQIRRRKRDATSAAIAPEVIQEMETPSLMWAESVPADVIISQDHQPQPLSCPEPVASHLPPDLCYGLMVGGAAEVAGYFPDPVHAGTSAMASSECNEAFYDDGIFDLQDLGVPVGYILRDAYGNPTGGII